LPNAAGVLGRPTECIVRTMLYNSIPYHCGRSSKFKYYLLGGKLGENDIAIVVSSTSRNPSGSRRIIIPCSFKTTMSASIYSEYCIEHGIPPNYPCFGLRRSRAVNIYECSNDDLGTGRFDNDINPRQCISFLSKLPVRTQLGHHMVTLSLTVLYDGSLAFSDKSKLFYFLPYLRGLPLRPPSPHLNLTGHLFLVYLQIDFRDDCIYIGPENPIELISRHFGAPAPCTLNIEWLALEGQCSHFFPPDAYRTSHILDLHFHVLFHQDHFVTYCLISYSQLKLSNGFTFDSQVNGVISHVTNDWLSLDDLASVLLPHANTLEDMIIAGSDGSSLCQTVLRCSLMYFAALKRLGIPETFLEYRHGSTTELCYYNPRKSCSYSTKCALTEARIGVAITID
jgi:hypothetical protein